MPLNQVGGSHPQQVRPQSKESKGEDTRKKGKMTEKKTWLGVFKPK